MDEPQEIQRRWIERVNANPVTKRWTHPAQDLTQAPQRQKPLAPGEKTGRRDSVKLDSKSSTWCLETKHGDREIIVIESMVDRVRGAWEHQNKPKGAKFWKGFADRSLGVTRGDVKWIVDELNSMETSTTVVSTPQNPIIVDQNNTRYHNDAPSATQLIPTPPMPPHRKVGSQPSTQLSNVESREEHRPSIPQMIIAKCKGNSTALEKLKSIPCFSRNFPPTNVDKRKWGNYQMPIMFDIRECIPNSNYPSYEQLLSSCLNEPRPAKRRQVLEVLASGFQPTAQHKGCSVVTGIELQGMEGLKLELPTGISKLEIADQATRKKITMNMCRSGATFDFHIDETSNLALLGAGTDVEYEKYWLFAPLTAKNLEVFQGQAELEHGEHDLILPRDIASLDDVIFFHQTPMDVIWIPTGALHATLSNGNSILYGSVFEIIEDIDLIARGLSALWELSKAHERVRLVERFIIVLQKALASRLYSGKVIRAICDRDFQKLLGKNARAFREVLVLLFEGVKSGRSWEISLPLQCGCEGCDFQISDEAITHLNSIHIEPLYLKSQELAITSSNRRKRADEKTGEKKLKRSTRENQNHNSNS